MKILVFSDSHGEIVHMQEAVDQERPDLIFHLGDHIRDADELSQQIGTVPVIRVLGNCDRLSVGQEILLHECRGVRFYLTHGHRHGVKTGLMRLTYAAMEADAQIAVFGHTHRPLCQEMGGVTLFNPGSCGGYGATYGVIEVHDGTFTCELMSVE